MEGTPGAQGLLGKSFLFILKKMNSLKPQLIKPPSLTFLLNFYTHTLTHSLTHSLQPPCLCDPGDLQIFITVRGGRGEAGPVCALTCCFQILPFFVCGLPLSDERVVAIFWRSSFGGSFVYFTLSTLGFPKLGHFLPEFIVSKSVWS